MWSQCIHWGNFDYILNVLSDVIIISLWEKMQITFKISAKMWSKCFQWSHSKCTQHVTTFSAKSQKYFKFYQTFQCIQHVFRMCPGHEFGDIVSGPLYPNTPCALFCAFPRPASPTSSADGRLSESHIGRVNPMKDECRNQGSSWL